MAIVPVQSVITPNTGVVAGGVTSFAAPAFGAGITAGNNVCGGFEFVTSGASTIGTITDDKGNVYGQSTIARNATDGNALVMFHFENIPAGGPTIITAHYDGTNMFQFNRFVITEFSGIALASALDVGFGGPTIDSGVVGTATFSAADVTTLFPGDLIYAVAIQSNASTGISLGAAFTALVYGANADTVPMRAEYRIQASAGSVNTGNAQFAGLGTNSNNYIAGMIPLKAATAGEGYSTQIFRPKRSLWR